MSAASGPLEPPRRDPVIPASVTLDGPVPSMRPRAGHPSGLPTAGITAREAGAARQRGARGAPAGGGAHCLQRIAAAKPSAWAPTRDLYSALTAGRDRRYRAACERRPEADDGAFAGDVLEDLYR